MTLVVKVGGAFGNSIDPLLADLAGRSDYVLVHGGSDRVDRLGAALGRSSEYLTSPSGVVSRKSDPAHIEVLQLALAGGVQTDLVAGLARHNVSAVGLSGVDGGLVLARRKEAIRAVVNGKVVRVHDDWSGSIERVDAGLLRGILGLGRVPVIGPPAVTERGEVVNVDADRVAARVAGALHAEALVLLTNVPGLLRDRADPSTIVRVVPRAEIDTVLPLAEGRMRKKVLAAREALEEGVGRVVIAPSTVIEPVRRALEGLGTVFQ